MVHNLFFCALFVGAASSAELAKPKIQPGQYVREGDSGTLTIQSDKVKGLTFDIESVGGNCHSCSITGVITGDIGYSESLFELGDIPECQISFSFNRSKITLNPITEENCRTFCGARAGFDGGYLLPPTACTNAGRQRLRDQSLRLYHARRFTQAKEILQDLIPVCGKFMNWIEVDQVKNDLALAQYHHGDVQQCVATLNTTLAGLVKDEEELKSGAGDVYLPPCDFDNYIELAKSIWFNKALCTKAIFKSH